MEEAKTIHNQKIDFLRAIAILGVFLFHAQEILFPNYYQKQFNSSDFLDVDGLKTAILNFSPTALGWTCVNLFLIISGFLIHSAYLKKPDSFRPAIFISKRFWRIYPAYLIVLLVLCFHSTPSFNHYLFNKEGRFDFLSHIFLIHNLFDKNLFSITPSLWSLALEAQLYLLYPFFLFFRNKLGFQKAFYIVLAFSFFQVIIQHNVHLEGSIKAYGASCFMYWYNWCAGAFVAELHARNRVWFRWHVPVFVFCLLLAIYSRSIKFGSMYTVYIATLGWLVFFEWVLIKKELIIGKLPFRFLTILGLCSYSFYLIHQPILKILIPFFTGIIFQDTAIIFRITSLFISFLCIYGLSYLLYLYIELPFISVGRKLRNNSV